MSTPTEADIRKAYTTISSQSVRIALWTPEDQILSEAVPVLLAEIDKLRAQISLLKENS